MGGVYPGQGYPGLYGLPAEAIVAASLLPAGNVNNARVMFEPAANVRPFDRSMAVRKYDGQAPRTQRLP